MTRQLAGSVCFGAAALITALRAAPAFADDTVVVASTPAAAPTAPSETGILPNPSLLRSGLFTLGVSYVPAVVVALESDYAPDDHLYVPVVGPWLNLADRGDCRGDCTNETVNKVLLVTDGVVQGLGALQIVGSFFFPQSRTVTVSNADGSTALALSVMPANFGRGSNGVLAIGEF